MHKFVLGGALCASLFLFTAAHGETDTDRFIAKMYASCQSTGNCDAINQRVTKIFMICQGMAGNVKNLAKDPEFARCTNEMLARWGTDNTQKRKEMYYRAYKTTR